MWSTSQTLGPYMVIYFNFQSGYNLAWTLLGQDSKPATCLAAAAPVLSKSLWAYSANKGAQCDFKCLADLLTVPWNVEGVALPCPPEGIELMETQSLTGPALCTGSSAPPLMLHLDLRALFSLQSSAQPLLTQCSHWSHPGVKASAA